jgi:hypothetical protein
MGGRVSSPEEGDGYVWSEEEYIYQGRKVKMSYPIFTSTYSGLTIDFKNGVWKDGKYIDRQIKKAQDDGFVTTLLGRRRYIPEINNKNMGIRQFAQRQAVNTPIQGTASDLIKLAMIKIAGQIKSCGLKTKMILQIHDELVFELPLEELDGLKSMVKDEMENVLKLDVPIKVDLKKGANWLEMSTLEERVRKQL